MSLMHFQRVDFSVGGPLLLEHVETGGGHLAGLEAGDEGGLLPVVRHVECGGPLGTQERAHVNGESIAQVSV